MYKTVYDNTEKYGYRRVLSVITYIKSQKKITNYIAYFLKALEENWDEDIVLEDEKNSDNFSLNDEEKNKKDFSLAKQYFESLDLNEKEELEEKVFNEYLKACGSSKKIAEIAFKNAKQMLILEYIDKNELFKTKQNKVEDLNEKQNNIITDVNLFNKYISKTIEYYRVVLNLESSLIEKIRKEVAIELGRRFIKKEVTLEMIDETIVKKIG